jgi:hypothetical protein
LGETFLENPGMASFQLEGGDPKVASAVLTLALLLGGGVYLYATGDLRSLTMGGIQQTVAEDQAQQYSDVVRSGTAIDRCVKAGLVAEAYLQAGESASYDQWKAVEEADCKAAGVRP